MNDGLVLVVTRLDGDHAGPAANRAVFDVPLAVSASFVDVNVGRLATPRTAEEPHRSRCYDVSKVKALSLFLLAVAGCQVAFPIVMEDLDGSSDSPTSDVKDKDNKAGDVVNVEDTGTTAKGGVWCGASEAGAISCQGTCCVTVGNGYSFACRALGDPCTGSSYAFSCDDSTKCPTQTPDCCYTEMGMFADSGGNYRAESHCSAGCNTQFDVMCSGPNGDCPNALNCQPWFSNYWVCR